MTLILFLTAILLASLVYIGWPFAQQNSSDNLYAKNNNLEEQKERLLEVYRDLEFDFQTDKIELEDFEHQKKEVLQELQSIYAKIDEKLNDAKSSN